MTKAIYHAWRVRTDEAKYFCMAATLPSVLVEPCRSSHLPLTSHLIASDLSSLLSMLPNSSSDNLVFMTNKGGEPGCAGEWTICGGSSQTYADETVSNRSCLAPGRRPRSIDATSTLVYEGASLCCTLYEAYFNFSTVPQGSVDQQKAPACPRAMYSSRSSTVERSQFSSIPRCACKVPDLCHAPLISPLSCVSQGSGCASEPTQFSGKLEGDQGVNIMSGTECTDETSCGCVEGGKSGLSVESVDS